METEIKQEKKKQVDISSLSPKEFIIIKGARMHNLKNVDLAIPRNRLIVITGLSGSGKSSLVSILNSGIMGG